jgi:ribosomal protein S18 acetylase RimI-like enzyme
LVETSGSPDYDGTRKFYETRGFVEEARIREHYQAGEGKIVCWKKLDKEAAVGDN